MYNHSGCKCFHHWIQKLFVILMWVSAVGFWWANWKGGGMAWGMDADVFFKDIVIFGFLVFSMKFCGCCRKMMMSGGMCKHGMDCKCGDCDRCK